MVIDYSKWDNFTVSSDEENEEATNEEVVTYLSMNSVANEPTAADKSGTAKISSDTTIASKPQHIQILTPCGKCSKMMKPKDIKYCSRCTVFGYCSKKCQIGDWKRHKSVCLQHNSDSEKNLNNMSRVVEKLVQLPHINSSKNIFSMKGSTPQMWHLIDLATVVKDMHKEYGPGVLVMQFNNYQECEGLVIELSIALQGSVSKYPSLPAICYEPWPFIKSKTNKQSPLQVTLQRADIASLMAIIGSDSFAFCVTMPASKAGANDGITQAFRLPYSSVVSTTAQSKFPVSAAPLSKELARNISDSPDYKQCREAMSKLQDGPGILWLRNIFTLQNGYERKEIKKMTPNKLLRSLKVSLTKKYKYERTVQSVINVPAIFSSLLDDGSYTCPMVAKEILPQDHIIRKTDKITDPNIVYGCFLTYMHSESDASVIREFFFSTEPN